MAEGSHATFAGWESKTCARCGGAIVKSREAAIFRRGLDRGGQPWSEHLGPCPNEAAQSGQRGVSHAHGT